MAYVLVAIVSVLAALGIWLFVRKELSRRKEWFAAAEKALGDQKGAQRNTSQNASIALAVHARTLLAGLARGSWALRRLYLYE